MFSFVPLGTKFMVSRHWIFAQLLVLLGVIGGGCAPQETTVPEKLTIGIVSYGEQSVSLDKYDRFKNYLAQATKSVVELEPAYNELQAVEQVNRKNWDIVFAPPGLAAIAISKDLYIPLFSLEGMSNVQRCLLIVPENSPIQNLAGLANKTLALGQPGSAAGYYMPLYDLYGLTLREIRFAPTPKTALQWISEGTVDAIALSEEDFERYGREFSTTKLRILSTSRQIPPGLVLLGPNTERNEQEQIQKAMREAPADIVSDAGYVPDAPVPGYTQFIEFVGKVRPLEGRVRQKPAVLTLQPSGNAEAGNTGTGNTGTGNAEAGNAGTGNTGSDRSAVETSPPPP
ncbi:MAG TPA: PhnD/SsuA/transferrin family substrate-binding protein, partial [Coleofasciculaceae cyanobacterium]